MYDIGNIITFDWRGIVFRAITQKWVWVTTRSPILGSKISVFVFVLIVFRAINLMSYKNFKYWTISKNLENDLLLHSQKRDYTTNRFST